METVDGGWVIELFLKRPQRWSTFERYVTEERARKELEEIKSDSPEDKWRLVRYEGIVVG
jgi:hypothetical protein